MGLSMKQWLLYTVLVLAPLTSVAQYGYANANVGYGNASAYGYANANLQGSGYWGGQQNCGYQQTQNTGRSQTQQTSQKSEEEKAATSRISELKKQLATKQLEKKRAESEMQMAARKLERVFDSEILDFLLETHIEKGNECKSYKTFPGNNCVAQSHTGKTAVAEGEVTVDANGAQVIHTKANTVVSFDCEGKEEVPEKLKVKWTIAGPGSYCTANSRSSGGAVSANICKDTSLRNDERKGSASTSDCGKSLTDYRKNRIKRDDVQAKIEKIEDDIETQQWAIADAKERETLEKSYRMSNSSEANCEECGQMSRDGSSGQKQGSSRDWGSILGNIGVGLGLAYVGKQYDERNAEYSAQLGYPPQSGYPTAVSMGAPYILNGIYGAVNGSNGQGSFGCGNSSSMNGMLGGMGGVNGMNGMSGMTGMSAFGYPQNIMGGGQMNGGGMYTMGYNPYNSMYGNTNPYASLYGNASLGYGTGNMTGTMANGYGNMTNSTGNNYQSNLLALQYQQQMAQYQMQYYQQQYQQQMQQYQQQQQVSTQSQQIQQEIYSLQMRLQNINTGTYNYGSTTSGLTYNGGYYGSYGTTTGTTYGTTTAPTWIPGSTSTIYTTPTTYSTTTNGR